MKKVILASLFIVTFQLSFSQILLDSKEIKFSKKTKTLRISTVDLSEKTALDLKDELIGWREKVISASVVEYNRQFVLVHNNLMDEIDLFDVLKKYGIKKEYIISYK